MLGAKAKSKNGTNHLLGMITTLSFIVALNKIASGGKLGLLHDHHLGMICPQNL